MSIERAIFVDILHTVVKRPSVPRKLGPLWPFLCLHTKIKIKYVRYSDVPERRKAKLDFSYVHFAIHARKPTDF